MTRNNVVCMQPDAAAHNSWLRSSRECGISALNEPDPAPRLGVPVPFGSTQPSHGCVRDTDQLVELPLIGITDSAAQKNLVINSYDRAVSCTLVRTLARVQHMTPCRATQRSHGPPDGLLNPGNAWAGLRPHESARNQLAFPRRGVSCFARSDSTAASDQTRMTCTTQFERNIWWADMPHASSMPDTCDMLQAVPHLQRHGFGGLSRPFERPLKLQI